MKRAITKLSLLAVTTTLIPFVAATEAEAAVVSCGATLTTNSVLTHDLTCPGNGVTLAPNVTLDLHGHTLRGSGSGRAVFAANTGTDVVKNGRITNWDLGMSVPLPDLGEPPTGQVGSIVVSHVGFDHNVIGIEASAGQIGSNPVMAFHISDSRLRDNGTGVRGLVANVAITRSGFQDNDDALSMDTGTVTASKLALDHNQTGVTCVESVCSLTGSVLRNNPTAVLSTFVGSFTLTHSVITGSTQAYNAAGFQIAGTVTHNVFARNTTAVDIAAGTGVVGNNVFVANGTALTATDTGTDTPLTLTRNVLVHNGDAITIDDATGVSVGHNLATHNTGWGIRVPNATDLGGNHANHNGNSPQCVGVVC
jgi:hypothetical protein